MPLTCTILAINFAGTKDTRPEIIARLSFGTVPVRTIGKPLKGLRNLSERSGILGQTGEELAAVFLQRQGYKILVRNYRQKCGEIDIIAKDGSTLVFVEVKTRKNAAFGTPFEAVTEKKQRQIGRVAQEYLGRNDLFNTPARFDVVSILMQGDKPPVIEHLSNAFDLL